MKGAPPQWSRRDCRFDHLVRAAIEKGFGVVLVYGGIEDFERADDIRRGIYRCAAHREVSADAGPSKRLVTDPDQMGIRKTGKTYELRYRLWDKRGARKRHIQKYGADRSQWPYDPRRKATPEEKLSWANRDETGQPVIH